MEVTIRRELLVAGASRSACGPGRWFVARRCWSDQRPLEHLSSGYLESPWQGHSKHALVITVERHLPARRPLRGQPGGLAHHRVNPRREGHAMNRHVRARSTLPGAC